jgi:N-acetylneuraminic acid mutarotase
MARPNAPLSRRSFLRGALFGGAGLLGASVLGCGDDGGDTAETATAPAPTATVLENVTISAPDMSWQQLAPSGETPAARYDHTLVSDGAKLYLFGGRGPEPVNDLWTYDLATGAWAQLNAQGAPAARFGHNAIWDSQRNVMVVFGGQADASEFFSDLWEFAPATNTWLDVLAGADPVALPNPRYGAAACLDDSGHMLITHGFTSEGRFDDTWQYDLAGQTFWTDLSGPEAERPLRRCLIDGIWDQRKRRFLIYGGQSNEAPFMDDCWGWSPEIGWQQIARVPSPSARNMYTMVYDEARTVALLIGGQTESGPVNDIWVFHADGESWSQGAPQGEAFPARYGHDAAITPDGTIYVFGGNDGATPLSDLWVLERGS